MHLMGARGRLSYVESAGLGGAGKEGTPGIHSRGWSLSREAKNFDAPDLFLLGPSPNATKESKYPR